VKRMAINSQIAIEPMIHILCFVQIRMTFCRAGGFEDG
jgi:hypothetical protein